MTPLILTVHFFRTTAGTEPVRDFLRSLAQEDRKSVGTDLKTVQFGWPLGMPLVRKLDHGLWESRSHIRDGIVRVLFTVSGCRMVLLHGFIKKSLRAPREIETARSRLRQLQRGER